MTRKIWAKTVQVAVPPKEHIVKPIDTDTILADYKTDPDYYDSINIIEYTNNKGEKLILISNTDEDLVLPVTLFLRNIAS